MSLIRGSVLVICAAISWNILSVMFKPKLPPIVEGHFHPKFRKVAEIFRSNIESSKERGASLALFYQGELLVDLWGGYADEESELPWNNETISQVFSVTKSIAAITAAKMVEKGWLDYSKPVAHYWPEFAQNQKENITVDLLLSHQSGLLKTGEWSPSLFDLQFNPEETEEQIAKAATVWPAGTQHGYHMVSFGYYVDTLLKKADPKHRNVGQIFDEEIGQEYGIDFHIGLPYRENYRAARLEGMSPIQLLLAVLFSFDVNYYRFYGSLFFRPGSFPNLAMSGPREMNPVNRLNNPQVRATPFSTNNGFSSAKALAKLYGILATGGSYKGKQLLTKQSIENLNTVMADGMDLVFMRNMTYGRGVFLHTNSQGIRTFGHPGYGGQVAYGDTVNGLGLSYVTNFISFYFNFDDPRYTELEKAVYSCLKQYIASKNS